MSTLKNLSSVEENIEKCKKRIQKLELTLKLKPNDEYSEQLTKELAELKQVLQSQESLLSSLRRDNRQNGLTALFVMILGLFLFYFISMFITQLFLPSV